MTPRHAFLLLALAATVQAQPHRAEQDREIRYWMLEPETHQFRISHDFNVTRPGQKFVHSFVRAGSVVSGAKVYLVDTGEELKTYLVTGKQVNALGYYPNPSPGDMAVVQADLPRPVGPDESMRVRVVETYTDPLGYGMKGSSLVFTRTVGRPRNEITLPAGWMLESVSAPAIVGMDEEGRVRCRFTNPRNDELLVTITARRRPSAPPR